MLCARKREIKMFKSMTLQVKHLPTSAMEYERFANEIKIYVPYEDLQPWAKSILYCVLRLKCKTLREKN